MVSTKVYALIATMALTGCASQSTKPPLDVRLIPNDCANRQMIVNYLEDQSRLPRATFESEKDYERSRAEIRHRIWTLRYYCQPV
jgi:hypothetical protein